MTLAAFQNVIRQQASAESNTRSMSRAGVISSYDPDSHAVKVTIQPEDVESNWMKLGAIGVGNGFGVVVGPNIGDEVLVEFLEGDFDSGQIVGRYFNVDAAAPAVPAGEIWAVHKSGQFLKITNDGKLTAQDAGGSVLTLNADGTSTLKSNLTVDGTLTVTKTITGEAGITITGTNPSGAASTVTGDFKIAGNIDSTGTITNNGKVVDSTHVHSNGNGGSNTGAPV